MTLADPLNSVLGAHGAVLLVAWGALHKYGDRSDLFGKSLAGVDSTLERLRRKISSALARHLEPVFKGAGSDPSPILEPKGNMYIEKPVNPVGGEAYREAVRDFVEGGSEAIADYVALLKARDEWCRWAKTRGWAMLFLFVWEFLAVCALGIGVALLDVPSPKWILSSSLVPTVFLALAVVALFAMVMRQDDRILHGRSRYDAA